MVILMVLERDFPPDLRVENEIKSLQENGHKVVLVCYTLKGETQKFEWHGSTVYKRKVSPLVYKSSVGALKFPFYFNFWRKHINYVLKNEKVDAVHIHDLPLAKVGYELKQRYGIRFILDLHENWPAYLNVSRHTNTFLGKLLSKDKQWRNYEFVYCNRSDEVIVVIDEAKDRLVQLGINASKIKVVANYPELSDFDNLPPVKKTFNDQGKIILFYAGGINYHRGLQFVIRSLPGVIEKYEELELRIFGEGNYLNDLKVLVESLKLENRVIFYGQVPYAKVLEELVQSHITLIPHVKNEHTDSTIPHKLFQYIFAGKPVLVSNCLPLERIIKTINAGAVYEWDNPNEAAKEIIWIIENYNSFDPDKFKDIVIENYNWDNETKRLVEIYSKTK